MEDNVPGFPGYHVTRSGNVYSRRVERSPNKFRDWHLLKSTMGNSFHEYATNDI